MSDSNLIYFSTTSSLILILLKLYKDGLKDLVTPLCLFYFFFAFGPIINYLIGHDIYFGIAKEYIPKASLIFFIALSSMIIGSFLWRQNVANALVKNLNLNALAPVYLISIIYASYIILRISLSGIQNKILKIQIAFPPLHYNYLLLQLYLISFFFLLKKGILKKLFYINSFFYIIYSMVMSERDFIFPIAALLFHKLSFGTQNLKTNLKYMVMIIFLLILATGVFFFRDSTQQTESILAAILNQGSLLFINTFTLKLLHERIDYFWGQTYLNSVLNLLPNWIYKTDFNTLEWFKNNYAEKSTSGYGYGLDAEAYLNFSYIGVACVFLFILFCQRKISRHIEDHPFFIFYSVFFMSFTMYSFRNDSLAFLKGNLYAVIFFFLIFKLSWKRGK